MNDVNEGLTGHLVYKKGKTEIESLTEKVFNWLQSRPITYQSFINCKRIKILNRN